MLSPCVHACRAAASAGACGQGKQQGDGGAASRAVVQAWAGLTAAAAAERQGGAGSATDVCHTPSLPPPCPPSALALPLRTWVLWKYCV